MLGKTDDFILRSSTNLKKTMVLKGNSTPTRLEKVLNIITGATIKFQFHSRVY